MGKEIVYTLNYRDSGERKSVDIKIDFLSRGLARDLENLNKSRDSLSVKFNEIIQKEDEIAELKKTKPDEYKVKLKELAHELNDLEKESKDKDVSYDLGKIFIEIYNIAFG